MARLSLGANDMIRAALLVPNATGWILILAFPLVVVCMWRGVYVGAEREVWTIQASEGTRTQPLSVVRLHCNYLTFSGIRTRWVTDLERQASCPRLYEGR